jgi:hypothetical protein
MRVVFGRQPSEPPPLFGGQAWMDAADDWARVQGLHIRQWRVNQQFRAAERGTLQEGCWYAIAWRDGERGQLGTWKVSPCQP